MPIPYWYTLLKCHELLTNWPQEAVKIIGVERAGNKPHDEDGALLEAFLRE